MCRTFALVPRKTQVDDGGDEATAHLSDVSVSSVSSYDASDWDAASPLRLSDVELDSDAERAVLLCGGTVLPQAAAAASASAPPPPPPPPPTDADGDGKRVRRLNSRYSNSYVGAEWRKMESLIAPAGNNNVHHIHQVGHGVAVASSPFFFQRMSLTRT